jgi:hypothetical protein
MNMVHKIEEPSQETAMQKITTTTMTVHRPPAFAPVADYHVQVDNPMKMLQ